MSLMPSTGCAERADSGLFALIRNFLPQDLLLFAFPAIIFPRFFWFPTLLEYPGTECHRVPQSATECPDIQNRAQKKSK